MRWPWSKKVPDGECGNVGRGQRVGGRTPVCSRPAGHDGAHAGRVGNSRCMWGPGNIYMQAGGDVVIDGVKIEDE